MADRIIASGDARPLSTASEPREFLTTGERCCRTNHGPEVAALHFNAAAPDASLLGLAIARATGSVAISDIVMQTTLSRDVQEALEASRDSMEEVLLILNELQRRDVQRYAGEQQ